MLCARVVAVAPAGSVRCEPSGSEIVMSAIGGPVYGRPRAGHRGNSRLPQRWAGQAAVPLPAAHEHTLVGAIEHGAHPSGRGRQGVGLAGVHVAVLLAG